MMQFHDATILHDRVDAAAKCAEAVSDCGLGLVWFGLIWGRARCVASQVHVRGPALVRGRRGQCSRPFCRGERTRDRAASGRRPRNGRGHSAGSGRPPGVGDVFDHDDMTRSADDVRRQGYPIASSIAV